MATFLRIGDKAINLDLIESVALDYPVTSNGKRDDHGVRMDIVPTSGATRAFQFTGREAANVRLFFNGIDVVEPYWHGDTAIFNLTPTEES